MADANRVQLTVRLRSEDKDFFAEGTESCGLEPSVAARQILELVIQRMRAGGDFVDALYELKTLLGVPKVSEIDRSIEAAQRALNTFKEPEEQATLLASIEAMEKIRVSQCVAGSRARPRRAGSG